MEQGLPGSSDAGRPCAVRENGEELPVLRAVELNQRTQPSRASCVGG